MGIEGVEVRGIVSVCWGGRGRGRREGREWGEGGREGRKGVGEEDGRREGVVRD